MAAAGLEGLTVSEAAAGVGGAITGVGAKVYVVGTLTAAEIQQLIASSGGRVVTVFRRLTEPPAAGRILHAAADMGLRNAIARGSMYVGRIPADLFQRLMAEGEITFATTEIGGVRGTEVIISVKAMQILQQFFECHGG